MYKYQIGNKYYIILRILLKRNCVTMNTRVGNIEDEDGIYNTPLHEIQAALERAANRQETASSKPTVPNLDLTKVRKNRTSRYDENMYSLPDLSSSMTPSTSPYSLGSSPFEDPSPPLPPLHSVTNKRTCTFSKRCLTITCLTTTLLGVLAIVIVAAYMIATPIGSEFNKTLIYTTSRG